MSNHVDENHAAAAILRKADSDGEQFKKDIVVSEEEKKAVGTRSTRNLTPKGGDRGAPKAKLC